MRLYELSNHNEDETSPTGRALSPTRGPGALDGTPSALRTPGLTGISQTTPLHLLDEVHTPAKKPADNIAFLPRLNVVAVLSEGILTFHSPSTLAPLSVHHYPSLRGVMCFSLDHAELASPSEGEAGAMHLCAIKRRSVVLIRVTREGWTTVKDLPLRGGAHIAALRRGYVCIADAVYYSVVDLNQAVAVPLLPISQEQNAGHEGEGPDPLQRPALACAVENEFLVASHTGSTTLGLFVKETGEPTRGTLEWASNVRSLVVDHQHSIALLHNGTIEIHSLHTQAIVQVVSLPTLPSSPSLLSSLPSSPAPSLPSSPTPRPPPSPRARAVVQAQEFQPRSLVFAIEGLDLGATGAGGTSSLAPILIPLRPRPSYPTTPTKPRRRSSAAASARRQEGKGGERTQVLVLGKNGILALTPLTLLVQAEALLEKGRTGEAVELAERSSSDDEAVRYILLRGAYQQLSATLFQDAFDLFLRSSCDPRLVLRLFPELLEQVKPLLRDGEEIEVSRGLGSEVEKGWAVDDYVMANLNRNYSPHLLPSVEDAPPAKELRNMLSTTATDCFISYLQKWRLKRKEGKDGLQGQADSRKLDMIIDTALSVLLASSHRSEELLALLDEGSSSVVFPQLEPILLSAGLHGLLAGVLLQKGETSRVLEIWTRIVEGTYDDDSFTNGLQKIFDLLWKTKDQPLVERWGIWLLQRDRALGLKLFSDPKQTLTFDTRDLFGKIRVVDQDAADMFLEGAVLQERDTDSKLHADLVKRYIDRLADLMADSATKAHLREQEIDYAALLDASPSPLPSFLSFLVSRYSAESAHALFDRVRLKAILFLGTSSKYDVSGMKTELEEMEMKGLRGLTLERAIVYGKLHLDRQALALLLHVLHDLTSAEIYCQCTGDLLAPVDVAAAASALALPAATSATKRKKSSSAKKEGDAEGRKKSLARLLVDMCLTETDGQEGGRQTSVGQPKEVARILQTQAVHLDVIEILPALPSSWPLAVLAPFLSGTLRRSLHSHQEASLLKALSVSQNFAITEQLGDLQIKMGPTVEQGDETAPRLRRASVVKLEQKVMAEKGYNVQEPDDAVELDLR